MRKYSVIPFLICLSIFLLTAILSTIFMNEGNVWAVMLVGAAAGAGVLTVNQTAENRRREKLDR